MKKNRIMELDIPELDARKILQKQLRNSFPRGKCDADCFILYKTLSKKPHGYFFFRILGEINTCSNMIVIEYNIQPAFMVIFTSFIFLAVLFAGIISFILEGANGYFILIGAMINIVFNLSICWQKYEHIQKFESLFITEHRDGTVS